MIKGFENESIICNFVDLREISSSVTVNVSY